MHQYLQERVAKEYRRGDHRKLLKSALASGRLARPVVRRAANVAGPVAAQPAVGGVDATTLCECC